MPGEEKLSSYLNKSKLVSNSNYAKKIRIAILGGFTLNGLEETMRVKCDEKKIQCTTYVSGYNQYNQEIIDEKSQLYKFSPDITFLIIDCRNVFGELFLNPYSLSAEERKQFVETKSDEIINLAKTLVKKSNSKLILSNFSIPSYSPIGINETREEFGLHDLPMIAIAKGKFRNSGNETFFHNGKTFKFEKNDPTLFFLQRLRDESHRFAISAHRAKRKKSISRSLLDQIEGIGSIRKRALLNHFGSARAVESASFQEIKLVEGVEEKVAKKIYNFFHE